MNILHLNSDEYKEYMSNIQNKVVLIPVGCIENHGHLPIGTDSLIANALGRDVNRMNKNTILTPTIDYGCHSLPDSGGGFHLHGSICMDNILFVEHLEKVVEGYYKDGHRNFIFLNCHFENGCCILDTMSRLYKKYKNRVNEKENIKLMNITYWNLSSKKVLDEVFPEGFDAKIEHAGVSETSIIMYLYPELVRTHKNIKVKESNLYPYEVFDFNKMNKETEECKYANLASPEGASSKKGELLWKEYLIKIKKIIEKHFN